MKAIILGACLFTSLVSFTSFALQDALLQMVVITVEQTVKNGVFLKTRDIATFIVSRPKKKCLTQKWLKNTAMMKLHL